MNLRQTADRLGRLTEANSGALGSTRSRANSKRKSNLRTPGGLHIHPFSAERMADNTDESGNNPSITNTESLSIDKENLAATDATQTPSGGDGLDDPNDFSSDNQINVVERDPLKDGQDKEPMEASQSQTRVQSLPHSKRTGRIVDIPLKEVQALLDKYGIEPVEYLSEWQQLVEVIRTSELVRYDEIPHARIVFEKGLEDYLPLSIPAVVRYLREEGFMEEEIRDLWRTGLKHPSRLDIYFINEVEGELKPATVALLKKIVGDVPERMNGPRSNVQEEKPAMGVQHAFNSAVERHGDRVSEPMGHSRRNEKILCPSLSDSMADLSLQQGRSPLVEESRDQARNAHGIIKLKEYSSNEDVATWLDDCLFRLESHTHSDAEKTLAFKCVLSGLIRQEAQEMIASNPQIQWRELILNLRHSYLPVAALYEANRKVQFMRYEYLEPFNEWHQKWESALRLSQGSLTKDVRRLLILQALPLEDQHKLSLNGHDKSYDSILNYMATSDCIRRSQGQKRQADMRPSTNQQSRMPLVKSNHSGYPKKSWKPSAINSASNQPQRTVSNQPSTNRYANMSCHKCGELGHISPYCPTKVRRVRRPDPKRSGEGTSKELPSMASTELPEKWKTKPKILPELDVLVGDDSTPEEANVFALEKELKRSQVGEQNLKKRRNRFLLSAKFAHRCPGLEDHYQALIDTGADVSLLDPKIMELLPICLYPNDSRMSGVGKASLSGLYGFCYLLVTVKESGQSQLLKVYVLEGLSGNILLGQDFVSAFDVSLKHQKGEFAVIIGDDPGVVNPSLTISPVDPSVLKRMIQEEEQRARSSHPKAMLRFSGRDEPPENLTAHPDYFIGSVHQHSFEEERVDQLRSIINPHLKEAQYIENLQLLWKYQDVFALHEDDLGYVPPERTNIVIELEGPVPLKRSYPCSPAKRIEFEETIKPLMEAGIIEECTDPGGVPALLVKKPNGTHRLVVDYRELNAKCRRIVYPMPNIDACLEALAGGEYYFIGDLAQGYHQLGIAPEERAKTVFLTPDRKLRYTRLPMGYVNAPFHFQKLINELIEGLQYKKCVGYFDDLISTGESWHEFMKNTELLFQRVREYNLKFKPEKCKSAYPEVKFLGHIVNKQGIKPNPAKVSALKAIGYPSTRKQLRSLLGLFTFFSRYIPQYSILAQPLFELTASTSAFKIEEKHKSAIDGLKNSLVEDCLLTHYRFDLPTKLSCDASDRAIGGILMQQETLINEEGKEDKSWRPVSYYSQILLKHQHNYTVSEKELLGILIGITKFRHYLEGREFVVETDHHALCQLPKLKFKNGRINRWSLLLQGFHYSVIYRSGETHLSDCLSRMCEWDHRKPITEETELEDRICTVDIINDILVFDESELERTRIQILGELSLAKFNDAQLIETYEVLQVTSTEPELLEELADAQRKNERYASIINDLQNRLESPKNDPNVLKLFCMRRGLLYRQPVDSYGRRLVLTPQMFKELFEFEHNRPEGGHFGPRKTYEFIRQHYWMPHLYAEVEKACRKCTSCNLYKAAARIFQEPQLKGVARTPFERLELDVQGPFKRSLRGNKYVLVVTDSLSRFVFAKATPHQETTEILKFLDGLFHLYGCPRIIQTDQGSNFMSDAFAQFINERYIRHYISNAYHPQGQGQVERMNRTISDRIRIYADVNHRKWDELLPQILFGINNAIHSITKYSPAFIFFGFAPRKPSDQRFAINGCTSDVHLARAQAHDRLVESQRQTQARLEKAGTASNYQPGDLVLIKRKHADLVRGKKLMRPYYGPCLVLTHERGHVKTLSLVETNIGHPNAFNVELTKPFHGSLTKVQKQAFLKFCGQHGISIQSTDDDEDVIEITNPLVDKITKIPDKKHDLDRAPILDSISRRNEIEKESSKSKDQPTTHKYNLRSRDVKVRLIEQNVDCSTLSLLLSANGDTLKYLSTLKSNQKSYLGDNSLSTKRVNSYDSQSLIREPANATQFNFCQCHKFFVFDSEGYLLSHWKGRTSCPYKNSTEGETFFEQPLDSAFKSANNSLQCHSSLRSSTGHIVSLLSSSSFSHLINQIYLNSLALTMSKPVADCSPKELVKRLETTEVKHRDAFKRLIFEKIGKTMITMDIVKRESHKWPQPPHGYPRWHLYHENLPNFIDKFICWLCGQFGKTPIRCSQCSWIYCKDCAVYLHDLHPTFCNGQQLPSKRHFMCFNLSCSGQPEINLMNADDLALYKSVHFRCRRVLCYLLAPPDVTFPHEERCNYGPMDWCFDSSLLTNHYGGEYYTNYVQEHPINWRQLCVPAIRRNMFFGYQQCKTRKETLRIWLLEKHPEMNRAQLSAALDCSNGWKDAIRQAKYHDNILSEGEQIIRNDLKLPAYSVDSQQVKMNIAPLPPPEETIQYDEKKREYLVPASMQNLPKGKAIKPDAQTMKKIEAECENELAQAESLESIFADVEEPHLQMYLRAFSSMKRKLPSSSMKENVSDESVPSTSTGITRPKYRATPVTGPNAAPVRSCPADTERPSVNKLASCVVVPASRSSHSFKKPERSINGDSFPQPTKLAPRSVKESDKFKKPSSAPKSISWSPETRGGSSSSSVSSMSSVRSGDRHGEKYFTPQDRRPFIRLPFWEKFSSERKIALERSLRNFSVHLGNREPTVQVLSSTKTESEREVIARERNFRMTRIFDSRPAPKHFNVDSEISQFIGQHQSQITNANKVILSLHLVTETVKIDENLVPQPIWVCIINHELEVVYETLVKVRAQYLHTNYHGLTEKMVKHQRPLNVVASQVIEFLVSCDIIVGAGIHNHLRFLGFCDRQISLLKHKFRDMTIYYSPRLYKATTLCVNALLLFKQRMFEPHRPHPVEGARTSMSLYLFEYPQIEEKSEHWGGIHYQNQHRLCGHPLTILTLKEFYATYENWPQEWRDVRWPREINFPVVGQTLHQVPVPAIEGPQAQNQEPAPAQEEPMAIDWDSMRDEAFEDYAYPPDLSESEDEEDILHLFYPDASED